MDIGCYPHTVLWSKIVFQLNPGILCLDLNPSAAAADLEEEDATDALLALAKEAAPEEKLTKLEEKVTK